MLEIQAKIEKSIGKQVLLNPVFMIHWFSLFYPKGFLGIDALALTMHPKMIAKAVVCVEDRRISDCFDLFDE